MRRIHAIFLSFLFLVACSSGETKTESAESGEQSTDRCLDNPELAQTWGDCNVKHTLYLQSASLAQCRQSSPATSGTVNFKLRIKADGSVRSAQALGRNQKNGKLVSCVRQVMKKMRFAAPPSGKEPLITIPFQLEP